MRITIKSIGGGQKEVNAYAIVKIKRTAIMWQTKEMVCVYMIRPKRQL